MSKDNKNNNNLIDIGRVFCALNVSLVHCQPMVPSLTPVIVSLTGFRTYFFVLLFFYFMPKDTYRLSINYLISRIHQLLTPYLIWTLIYSTLRLISMTPIKRKYYINEIESIIFFGNSGVQLHFIPLILIGLIIYTPLFILIKSINSTTFLILVTALTLVFRPATFISSFNNTAFANNPTSLRILYLSTWLLPFIFISILFHSPKIDSLLKKHRSKVSTFSIILLIITLIPIRHKLSDHIAILQSILILLICIFPIIKISKFNNSNFYKTLSSLIFYSHPLYIESYQYIKRTYLHSITFSYFDISITLFFVFFVSIKIIPFLETHPRLKRLVCGR